MTPKFSFEILVRATDGFTSRNINSRRNDTIHIYQRIRGSDLIVVIKNINCVLKKMIFENDAT